MKRLSITVGALALTVGLASPAMADRDSKDYGQATTAFGQATLTGFASLPAETFVPNSEPSGSAIGAGPFNGITGPFADQPVQGFSGAVNRHDGSYDVLSDNGYGNKANSADFLLRVHRVKPDTKTGKVKVLGGFNLSDPYHKVPFPLTRADRVLTGADFDVESIVRAYDGSYWLGDEFGPFLLHFSPTGRLLEAPISLDGVQAPENPYLNGAQPTTGSSKGFEGMVRGVDGRHLYPLLEGTVNGDTPGDLRFSEFDLKSGEYTGKRFTYRLESPSNAIGDAIAVDKNRFLVIERDGGQGADAKFKRIYLADTRDRNGDGAMDKTLVADLMNIANPKGLGGFGETFTFPFTTIEDVVLLDNRTLAVLNDNNFPFSSGRTPGKADNNEFITIKLSQSLKADKRALR
ncbi:MULTISPECIES: esterase-like activity of phytase family protein [unclassified Streptomyces]|uniref:esterase-like activity of phytase family protein n=1 Tax=unclassified Streptomyces TaxID=2593676 RepID=UPI002E2FCC8B|nr:esterase-like activity of phytase family protein [Streptomyces sp. NBC_01356]WTB37178.1 esterase-like activity of phytase family protein [Streptomyces sp. NBC_00827]